MAHDYDSDLPYSRLLHEYRTEHETTGEERLYSVEEARDLVERIYGVLRKVATRELAELILVQGYIEVRPSVPSGCVSVFIQVAPKDAVRVTRRVQTLVLADEDNDRFSPF